jgi:hypothetical protein
MLSPVNVVRHQMADIAQAPNVMCGEYTGKPLGQPDGRRRFYQCAVCGGWVDSFDAGQVAEHDGQPLPIAFISEAS